MPSEPEGMFAFGDVVVVLFPYTNQFDFKQRPAVVVSGREYNRVRPDVVVMAVTSQLRATAAFGEVWIAEWQEAGLLKASAVKPLFTTIEQRMIVRRLGALQSGDLSALRKAINELLG